MKLNKFYLLPFAFLLASAFLLATGCRPAASPVSVSDKPMQQRNNTLRTNIPMPPNKPVSQMTWKTFDGVTNEDGKDQTIGDLKGKVIILDFWATYCPPCLEEIPHLNELQTKYKDQGFEVIGLNVGGEEDRPKVPAFAKKLEINYTLATPEDDLVGFIFQNNSAIPQTVVLDREGKLVERFIGYDLKVKTDLEKTIEKAIAK